jgi:taurine--2-oxoglutarate transaminase
MTLVDDRTASTVLPNGLTLADARAQAARAHELDRAHVFHSWSAQAELNPMTIVASQGSYVWDGEGNRLLDFSSQLVNTNIGHQHPKVVAAQAQAASCAPSRPSTPTMPDRAARLIAAPRVS